MGIHIFFTAVWNGVQITHGSEHRHAIHCVSIFNLFIILFVTSYYIVSKWWPASEWKKKTLFFALANFSSGWTARAKFVTFKS